jgi:hypothetical protein
MNSRFLGLLIGPAGILTGLLAISSSVRAPLSPLPEKISHYMPGNKYSHHAGDFRSIADGYTLSTSSPTPAYPHAEDPSVCDGSNTQSQVQVTAEQGVSKLPHKGTYRINKKSFTYVLARIDVTDCDFTPLGIPRGHRAYWVVEPDEYLILRSHIVEVGLSNPPTGTPAYQEQDLTTASPWTFSECPQSHNLKDEIGSMVPRRLVCSVHEDPRLEKAKSPKDTADAIRQIFSRTKQRGANLFLEDDGDDILLWIVCADGCCYANS